MKNTLKSLWLGQICPADELSSNYYHRKQFRDLDHTVAHDLEALRKQLAKEERDILERCIDNIYERQAISETDAFINGFSLGVKIITEAVTDD